MSRPKFKELAYMLGVYSNKTIPQTYINEFSNYELLLSLLHKINEVIETVNGYNEVMNEIQALLDDLDDEIKDEVERLLQEMYDSGEFEDILADILSDYYDSVTAPKTFKIDTRREFRICRPVMPYNTTTVNGEWYSYCQGGKYFVRAGVKYYVCCLRISRTDNSYRNNNRVDIRVYRYNDLNHEWEFSHNNIYPFGHGNDICYIDKLDKFAVAFASAFNSTLQTDLPTREIGFIDFNLPHDTYVTLTNNQIFADYQIEPETPVPITCVDYYDNKLWFGRGAGATSTKVGIDCIDVPDSPSDYSWFMETPTVYTRFFVPTTTDTPYTMVMAGMCQNQNYIFLGNTAPAGIYRFNKTTKKIDCFYEVGNYSNNHMYPTGEFENLSCVDDIIYIGTSIHGNQQLWYYDYTQVFSFDFANNTRIPSGVTTSYGGFYRIINLGSQHYTLDAQNNKIWAFDDTSVNSAKREISNPNGLSGKYGDPFPTWEEAILFINSQNLWDTITIHQQTTYMVEYVCINSSKNIFIDGATPQARRYPNMSPTDRNNNPLTYSRMGGIYIDGTNIAIDHMWIQNLSPLNLTAYSTHQIFVRNSNAAIHSCIFYVTGRSGLGQVYDNNILNINRGFLNTSYLRPVTYSGVTHTDADFSIGSKYVLSTTEGSGTSESPYYLKYMTCYQCTINAFGDYVKGDTTGSFDKFFILS